MRSHQIEDAKDAIAPQLNSDFGSLLTPIHAYDDAEIKISDLIVDKQFIANYFKTLNLNKMPPIENILAQPSPLGMTLIADYYQRKNDQHCRMYIASTMEDFQNMISEINSGPNDNKTIVIFQPTNIKDEWKEMFYVMHKVVVYLEKKESVFHMLIVDSTPFTEGKEVCMYLADDVLQGTERIYYTQEPVLDPIKKTSLCLQADNWNCGTHAFRLARIIAKDPNFLDNVEITSTLASTSITTQIKFKIPPAFAKCADNKISRHGCGTLFEGTFPALAVHYAKYNKDHSYIIKFTRKYLSQITIAFIENSQADLKMIIKNADARNFKAEPITTHKLLKSCMRP